MLNAKSRKNANHRVYCNDKKPAPLDEYMVRVHTIYPKAFANNFSNRWDVFVLIGSRAKLLTRHSQNNEAEAWRDAWQKLVE